ncbi:MAG: PAS domain S-box protein [Campylobacterota bacterium]|nr:PAS domain S-box protein [Campylobacterota bacterium]
MNLTTAYDIGVNKPDIPEEVLAIWQEMVDSLSTIAKVPSALIMHALANEIEVARTSGTRPAENPYEVDEKAPLGSGLYCETVMQEKRELYVPNALKDEAWKNNPDVALGMISYYGQPLLWPDNTIFGTICILDNKDMVLSDQSRQFVGLFRKAIENDLRILVQANELIEAKKHEIDLNRHHFQSVFEVMPNILITTDGEMIDKANPAMLKFVGYETLDGFKNEHDCICDLFEEGEGYLQSVMNGVSWLEYMLANPMEIHKVCMISNGKRHRFIVWAKPLKLDEKHRSVVSFTDITEFEEVRERLEYAINGANEGLWDWNLETDEVYFSPNWKKMLGYKDDELPNLLQTWEERVHPDDLKKAEQDIALSHAEPGRAYENIYRLRHRDGHWVWVLDRGQTIFDENGKAKRMIGFHTDISEQKNLENQLRASQQQFERFMENIPAGIVIKDEECRVLYANRSSERFFGRESILGMNAYALLPKDTSSQLRALNERAKEIGYAEAVIEYSDRDRAIFRVLTFAIGKDEKNLQTGSIYLDITEQYRDQHEIAKFKQILEKSPVSIVITDVDGNIEYINPWFTQVTGYSQEEAIGQNPRILKSDYHSASDYEELWSEITKERVWSGMFKNIKKNGEEYWESAIIAPVVSDEGAIVNYIGVKQEITEQVYLKAELEAKEEMMIVQSRHAAMGEMIGMIAHQWRQPITVIAMGANNILLDIELKDVNEESLKESAQSILKQTQYLSKTIDDFRNFFRPDKEKESVDLAEVMTEAEKIIGKSLEHSEITIAVKNENSKSVETYSRELLQVYINLLKNAKEALIDNKMSDRHINVLISSDKEHVVTTICDNGGGIDEAIIEKIFDPYFSTKDAKIGTGLGLYMSKTIVEKHLHGTISVENSDEGACFKIAIPLEWGGIDL